MRTETEFVKRLATTLQKCGDNAPILAVWDIALPSFFNVLKWES